LHMTAPELLKLQIIDDIIPEPLGGAHRDRTLTAKNVSQALTTHFSQLQKIPLATLLKQRESRFRSLGSFRSFQDGAQNVKTVNS